MARKSRKTYRDKLYGIEAPKKELEKVQLRTALYCRLSIADKQTGKDSMQSQLALVRQFAESREDELQVIGEFVDDGYSGTNYNRPQFKKMMEGVREGRIQCIVVKDLSRLGRNYLDTSYLIEITIPLYGARLLSVNDSIDSSDDDFDTILLGLKNLMNQQYAEDISRKVGTQIRFMRSRGEMAGGLTPYGYRRNPEDWKHLLIDEETAPVVRKIFQMAVDGKSPGRIAAELNNDHILTPMDHHILQWTGKRPEPQSMWRDRAVFRILHSEVYLGHMYYGETEERQYFGQPVREKKHSEWKVVRNVNPPIVTQEMFDKAARSKETRERQGELKRGQAPYGYQWDPRKKGYLMIDEEAAAVVRRIFAMKIQGKRMREIAAALERERILTPTDHWIWVNRGEKPKERRHWTQDMIIGILRSEVYLGHMYYDTKRENSTSRKDLSEWKIVKDMNPPIISQETFDRAADARMTAKKKRGINTKPVIYGYTADPENPDMLMIDEEAAASIRHIFDLKASGKSIRVIAEILNQEEVLTPRDYQIRRLHGALTDPRRHWRPSEVYMVVSSQVYLGHVYYDTYEKGEGGKRKKKKRTEWKVKKNVNPPIVSQELFDRANAAVYQRNKREFVTKRVVPYGYQKDPENDSTFRIDEEAAAVIRRIFFLRISGMTVAGIAEVLEKEGIPTPRDYRDYHIKGKLPKWKKHWSERIICRILHDRVYLGHMFYDKYDENGNARKRSEWKTVRNINPPIVTQDIFDQAASFKKGGDEADEGR